MSVPKKPWPSLPSDEAAERFVAEADLTEYDWSLAEPVSYEFPEKVARVLMQMPERQFEAIKSEAARRGIEYHRFMRELLDLGLRSLRP